MNPEQEIKVTGRPPTGEMDYCKWMMLAILVLAFFVRAFKLDAQSFWFDETVTVYFSNQDMLSLLRGVLEDRVHPPLFYVLTHFWLLIGKEQFVVRVFAVIWGVLSVAVVYPVGRLVGGRRVGTLSALLLALSPYAIWYSQEARMYSLISFLVLMANYFFIKTWRGDLVRYWVGYSVFTLLSIWTHHICLFIIPAQLAFLVLNRRRYQATVRRWLICITLIGLLYLPWVVAIFATGGFYSAGIGWVPFPQLQDLFWTLYEFALGSTSEPHNMFNLLIALIFLSLLALSFLIARNRKTVAHQRSGIFFIACWLFIPLILVFLISLDLPIAQKRSIYMDRYFTPLSPAYTTLVAYGLSAVFKLNRKFGLLALLAVLIPASISLRNLYFDERYFRDDWRGAVRYIQQGGGASDPMLIKPSFFVPLLYHYQGTPIPWVFIPEPVDIESDYDTYLSENMQEITRDKNRFWQVVTKLNTDTHRFVNLEANPVVEAAQEDAIKNWLDVHYRIVEEKAFNGIFLTLYEVD